MAIHNQVTRPLYNNHMQKTLQNLAQTSLIFLVIFGGLHICSSFLVIGNVENRILLILFNSLDLPFLLSALIYGSTKLSLTFEKITGDPKKAFIVCSAISVALFATALYLNFALPDAKLF